MAAKIPIDLQQVEAFCRRHGIRKLSLFGSLLTDDFGPQSDIDVLVEFEHVAQLNSRFSTFRRNCPQCSGEMWTSRLQVR